MISSTFGLYHYQFESRHILEMFGFDSLPAKFLI